MDPATLAMIAQMFSGMGKGLSSNAGGLGSIFGNIFNDPRHPYSEAQRAYGPWMDRASNAYNPFYKAGTDAIGKFQGGLDQMANPSDFINKLMGNYKESDYSKYLQDQAGKAGINAASASGMIGSTPFAQQMQQNAAGIASQDMNQWLQNVLGINRDYLSGYGDLMHQGFNAATGQSNIFGQRAGDEGNLAYAKERAANERGKGILGGLFSMFGG